MSEHNPIPTDVEDFNWAYAATPYTTTKPDAAKREIGWQPKDESPPGVGNPGTPGEIIPAAINNWLLKAAGEAKDWLHEKIVRTFAEVHEAVTAGLLYPQTFRLYTPGSELRAQMGIGSFTTVAGSSYDIADMITDGCKVFALMQDAYALGKAVIAIHPDVPGTALWTWSATNTKLICCDGRYVYLHDLGVDGIRVLDADTGVSQLLYDPVTPDVDYPIAMVANGRHLAVIDGTTPDVIEILSVSVPAPGDPPVITSISQVDLTGSTDIHMCLHGSVLYVVHTTAAVETHVAAYRIDSSPAGVLFDVNITSLWTAGTVPGTAIACDGDRVYVATEAAQPTATEYGCVHAFAMGDGARVWSHILWSTYDCLAVAPTRGVLWAVGFDTADYFLYQLDSQTGALRAALSGPDVSSVITADELCCYMRVRGDVTKFTRIWRGGPAVEMQVVNGYDIWRSPTKHRAVPVR